VAVGKTTTVRATSSLPPSFRSFRSSSSFSSTSFQTFAREGGCPLPRPSSAQA